jgi:hypothetical protein
VLKGEEDAQGGMATVSDTVSKAAPYITTRQNSTELAETRPLRANAPVTDPETIHDMKVMNQQFILFRRAGVYYCEDTTTGKQLSLRTKDEGEAKTLLNAKNESFRQPILNLEIARTYMAASDPQVSKRTWQSPMDAMTRTKTGSRGPCCQRSSGQSPSTPAAPCVLTHGKMLLERGGH